MKILKRTVSHDGQREAARWVPAEGCPGGGRTTE